MGSYYRTDLKILCLDTETNMGATKLWCTYAGFIDESICYFGASGKQTNLLMDRIAEADYVVGHNIIGFDRDVLSRLAQVEIPEEKLLDTLILSRLFDPSRTGGHSLASWGEALGYPKIDFDDYDGGYTQEMGTYCERDVEILHHLVPHLLEALEASKFSEECILMEHRVAVITDRQRLRGFKFDEERATDLFVELSRKMKHHEKELQERYEPIVTERWSEKTGKRLKDDVEVFNLGSRQQVAKRLLLDGVQLTKKTEGGQWKIDETILSAINHPSAAVVAEYMMLQKRVGMLDNWLSSVGLDGRLHGSVNTNGAISGRMTHSKPNLAQVPSARSPYGDVMRSLFTVESGKVLVGVDASGLELRILAHYMQDEDYIDQILSGDIHAYNQGLAGLETRDQAKTFIYALIYGAGDGKLGEIVGGTARDGKDLRARFLASLPSFQELMDKITRIAKQGNLPGLDGRRLRIRHAHAALNQLLQGGGAIAMKQALVILTDWIRERRMIEGFVANVHDEWQQETSVAESHRLGRLGCLAIKAAGEHFELRCPLAGEYNLGKTWLETH